MEISKVTATFHVGDAIEVMSKLPEKSVDLILTSPPFLALRSYLPADHPDKALEGGSQATPGAYIDWLLDVVEACSRVLAPHGSLCIELGDTYSGSGGGGGDYLEGGWREGQAQFAGSAASMKEPNAAHWRQKNSNVNAWPLAKSLSLIPETFRFAMVYGFNPHTGRTTEPWRLRNVIRWVRPNPPVGALGDKFRPATSELMVFCKSAKRYFDLDSVREPARMVMGRNVPGNNTKGSDDKSFRFAERVDSNPAGAPPLDWWTIPTDEAAKLRRACEHDRYEAHRLLANAFGEVPEYAVCPGGEFLTTRNDLPLDWWNIPPGGYEGAHYAVFPPELCVKPVKAMCPEKVCRQCGEPSRRLTEVGYVKLQETNNPTVRGTTVGVLGVGADPTFKHGRANKLVETLGFTDCGHDDWRNGVVLDPFVGSGTTLAVATGHGRDAIGIDLDARNYDLALQRVGPFILERAM